MSKNDLIRAAQDAQKQAYAVYSNFCVGAAVRAANGKIYQGCNVENASFGLTVCAERTALFTAIAAGEREFSELAVVSAPGVSPCGACRQVIWELCGDIPITLVDADGNTRETSSARLLPDAFGKEGLSHET